LAPTQNYIPAFPVLGRDRPKEQNNLKANLTKEGVFKGSSLLTLMSTEDAVRAYTSSRIESLRNVYRQITN